MPPAGRPANCEPNKAGRGWKGGARERADDGFFAAGIKRRRSKADFAPTWQGVTIRILSGCLRFYLRSTQSAFCPAVHLRRTSVLPQAKPWRRGNSLAPSIFNHRRVEPSSGRRNPKKKDICFQQMSFFFGAGEGNRTPVFSLGS